MIPGDAGYLWPPVPTSDGALVARARDDGTVAVHDLRTGALVTTITASSPGRRVGIGFSPDRDRLVTVSEGDDFTPSVLVTRDISDERLVRVACRTAGRDLTADEWRTLVGDELPADLRCG